MEPSGYGQSLVAELIHFRLFGIILPTIKLKVYTFGGTRNLEPRDRLHVEQHPHRSAIPKPRCGIFISLVPECCPHISAEHTAPHRRGGANQNDHRPQPTAGGGDKACNDDISTNKRQQPYQTSPHRRGGANQKDHRPHSTGVGGDEAKQDQPGESNKAKQDKYPLDRQGGIPWGGGGGEGGCGSPASYIYIYISHIYIYTHTHTSDPYIA